MKDRIVLVHWNAAEARKRAQALRLPGYDVEATQLSPPALLKRLREKPPAAVVIDLERLPSHGREIGRSIRTMKATRRIPLVFAGGAAEKVARVRELMPDAVFTGWDSIGSALERAIARPVKEPVVPKQYMDEFKGTPLVKKLGVRPWSTVALVRAPAGLEETLGELPEGARLRRKQQGRCDLVLWFVRSENELARGIGRMPGLGCPVWICWPKQASAVKADVTQNLVRKAGLSAGMVDYKVCSIDATWSGLLFRRRSPASIRL